MSYGGNIGGGYDDFTPPADWSNCVTRGSVQESYGSCNVKGFFGSAMRSNGTTPEGYYQYCLNNLASYKCENPAWSGWWIDAGCVNFKKVWKRRFDPKHFDKNAVVDWLVANRLKEGDPEFLRNKNSTDYVITRNLDWNEVIVTMNEVSNVCQPYWETGWIDNGCNNARREYYAIVNPNGNDLTAAVNRMRDKVTLNDPNNTMGGNMFIDKSSSLNRVLAYTRDESCGPLWMKSGDVEGYWKDNGCNADGKHVYSRQINSNGFPNPQNIADTMKASLGQLSTFNGQTVSEIKTDIVSAGAPWIHIITLDDSCVIWGEEQINKAFGPDIINYKRCKTASGAIPAASLCVASSTNPIGFISCEPNQNPDNSNSQCTFTGSSCTEGKWCYAVTGIDKYGNVTFDTALTTCADKDEVKFQKCLNWLNPEDCSKGAEKKNITPLGYISCETSPQDSNCTPSTTTNSCIAGKNCYIMTSKEAGKCTTTRFLPAMTYCKDGEQIEYRMCTSWHGGDVNSCKEDAAIRMGDAPLGWIKTDKDSSPDGKQSGFSNTKGVEPSYTFNCTATGNCYAITKWNKASKTCAAQFGNEKSGCVGLSKSVKSRQCTNMVNGNVQSCKTSPNVPETKIGWQYCEPNSSPAGAHVGLSGKDCSATSTEFNCKEGKGCFVITAKNDADNKCETLTDYYEATPKWALYGIPSGLLICCVLVCVILLLIKFS